jgi:hypothetical protein
MSRRFEDVQAKRASEVSAAKGLLKRLEDRQRAEVLVWLCAYFDDAGTRIAPDRPRRRIVVDGVEYWLVRVPKLRSRPPTSGPD